MNIRCFFSLSTPFCACMHMPDPGLTHSGYLLSDTYHMSWILPLFTYSRSSHICLISYQYLLSVLSHLKEFHLSYFSFLFFYGINWLFMSNIATPPTKASPHDWSSFSNPTLASLPVLRALSTCCPFKDPSRTPTHLCSLPISTTASFLLNIAL